MTTSIDTAVKKPATPRRRGPARDHRATDRLLEAAEQLFGTYGLDGVSLRQIQIAAGSGNNFAVQYHFGDVAGLVRALLENRMPAVDARQAELLDHAEADGHLQDNHALLSAFFTPLLDQRNSHGERSYARFISALLRGKDGDAHCRALFHLTPTTGRIMTLLQSANPHLSSAMLSERLRLLSAMVCNSVYNRLDTQGGTAGEGALVADALAMAAAALAVPPA